MANSLSGPKNIIALTVTGADRWFPVEDKGLSD